MTGHAGKQSRALRQMREVDPKALKEHPLARIVPPMRHDEWGDFYRDVAFAGIRVPLEILADGTVLDGRHRLIAALELGMPSVPVIDAPLNGDSAEVYMLKAAVIRRHLTDDQRGLLAARWKQEHRLEHGQAQERTEEGRFTPRGGERVDTPQAAVELFKVQTSGPIDIEDSKSRVSLSLSSDCV